MGRYRRYRERKSRIDAKFWVNIIAAAALLFLISCDWTRDKIIDMFTPDLFKHKQKIIQNP